MVNIVLVCSGLMVNIVLDCMGNRECKVLICLGEYTVIVCGINYIG
jgi:hypothetical protein